MARITVTIEGEPNEIRGALQTLLRSVTASPAADLLPSTPTPRENEWDPESVQRFLSRVKASAFAALRIIAEYPDGCPQPTVEERLRAPMRARLASVTIVHDRDPEFNKKPVPLEWIRVRDPKNSNLVRGYKLRPEFVEALQEGVRAVDEGDEARP